MLTRRAFGRGALASSGALVAGCVATEDQQMRFARRCTTPGEDERFYVDMHCHLINNKDVNGAAFFTRRGTDLDEGFFLIEAAAGLLARSVLAILDAGTYLVPPELAFMAKFEEVFQKQAVPHPRDYAFCRDAYARQRGLYIERRQPRDHEAYGDGRYVGFASHRSRNAAALMALAPEVDIFTPSMVDLYEGPDDIREAPRDQVDFYMALNLATRGRFLPLVSFSPVRQFVEDRNFSGRRDSPLELVERCITEMGFIGVKVHPSSGFNPVENAEFGCPNTPLQFQERLTAEQARCYDEAMERLFRLCQRLDVPILTHASDSLYANGPCMHPKDRSPEHWTNSPEHWAKVLKICPDLRICLAHFASRFHDQKKAQRPGGGYGDDELPAEFDADGRLVPSAWLAAALEQIARQDGDAGFYLDLAFMPHLALSAAKKLDWEDETDWISDKLIEQKNAKAYERDYAGAFNRFLVERPHLARSVMYGSDWHMPAMSAFGRGNQYLQLIESVIPGPHDSRYRQDVMGMNAVKFFGLHKDGANRERLETFYGKSGVDLASIPWMKRVDQHYL